jgi:CarboxypepD_reg-like domain
MKTTTNKIFNKTGAKLVILVAIYFIAWHNFKVLGNSGKIGNDQFLALTGKIIDKETLKPIMFANIYVVGTFIGTVANSEGEFLLKIPKDKLNENIGVSHLGYKNFTMEINKMSKESNEIKLEPEIVPLKEIIVKSEDPIILLKGAINSIHKNYRTSPVMLKGFYRETIQQNKKYVSIAEAVLDAYKAPYNGYANDRVKIVIGRKSQDVKRMDTIIVKLQGGPITPFFLDIVKNPESILSEEYFKYYDYKLTGQITLGTTRCYVIEFNQKQGVDQPLFSGKIYLDVEKLAIVGLEFGLSEYGLPLANNLFLMKKPLTLKFETVGADYYIRYTETNGKWCLNYVRSELRFTCKWKRRLFKSSYAAMVEMAVTDIDTTDITKYPSKETTKFSDIFSDKVESFTNPEFWGDYNIIKPDESIQSAIEKLGKKLKKK